MKTMSGLENLRAGSYVKVHSRYNKQGYTVAKITRETSTQFVIGDERYRKTDGYRIGDKGYYNRSWILTDTVDVTPEEITAYEAWQAEKKRCDAAREHVDYVKKCAVVNIARKMGLGEDGVKVQANTNDGYRTVTYKLEIEGLTEEDLLRYKS